MRIFFDTSVLIPLAYGDHPHHDASMAIIDRLGTDIGFCSSHGLLEAYSSLTRMPGRYRVSADQARLFIGSLREKLQAIALTEEEYSALIDNYASAGIVGGHIYDGLHAHCAVKARAEVLLTWNAGDFMRFTEVARLVKTPLELQPGG